MLWQYYRFCAFFWLIYAGYILLFIISNCFIIIIHNTTYLHRLDKFSYSFYHPPFVSIEQCSSHKYRVLRYLISYITTDGWYRWIPYLSLPFKYWDISLFHIVFRTFLSHLWKISSSLSPLPIFITIDSHWSDKHFIY